MDGCILWMVVDGLPLVSNCSCGRRRVRLAGKVATIWLCPSTEQRHNLEGSAKLYLIGQWDAARLMSPS